MKSGEVCYVTASDDPIDGDLSLPEFLRIPAAQRAAAWVRVPPKPWPKFSERTFGGGVNDADVKKRLEREAAAELEKLDRSRGVALSEPPAVKPRRIK